MKEFVWEVEWNDPKIQVKVLRVHFKDEDFNLGFITLDFRYRCWDLGCCTGGLRRVSAIQRENTKGQPPYEGSNWKKRMTEDAQAVLLKAVKEMYPCT